MHKNTHNFNSNIHFWPLGSLGGPLGGQSGFWAEPGGFSEARALVSFYIFCISPLQSSGGVAMSNYDFTHLSIHAIQRKNSAKRKCLTK